MIIVLRSAASSCRARDFHAARASRVIGVMQVRTYIIGIEHKCHILYTRTGVCSELNHRYINGYQTPAQPIPISPMQRPKQKKTIAMLLMLYPIPEAYHYPVPEELALLFASAFARLAATEFRSSYSLRRSSTLAFLRLSFRGSSLSLPAPCDTLRVAGG